MVILYRHWSVYQIILSYQSCIINRDNLFTLQVSLTTEDFCWISFLAFATWDRASHQQALAAYLELQCSGIYY